MLVGCIPNSPDFQHPADRRRYLFYFSQTGIQYETALFEKSYSVIYVSISADLEKWSRYKTTQAALGNDVKVIFDLSDFYFAAGVINDSLRSIFHFIAGRTSVLSLSYRKTLLRMIEGTDLLLCGSDEQKQFLTKYHPNVMIMRDYFGRDIKTKKTSYDLFKENEINVFWEGLAHGNAESFRLIRTILERVQGYHVRFHIVTDPDYCRIGGSHFCQPTYRILKRIFSGSKVQFHLYDWNSVAFSAIAASCDMAIIPIPDDPVMRNKPENKLLLLWSVGLPVITTSTPSYARVMNSIGENYACNHLDEWRKRIELLASSKDIRKTYMARAQIYLDKHCADQILLNAWQSVFR